MTDPGWVFLIAKSKGLIVEKGSMLSHSAIISRELGIPAVVGIKDCVDIFKNGDIVTLDGTNGSIKKEGRK
jgi:pyruvate,water dikinase